MAELREHLSHPEQRCRRQDDECAHPCQTRAVRALDGSVDDVERCEIGCCRLAAQCRRRCRVMCESNAINGASTCGCRCSQRTSSPCLRTVTSVGRLFTVIRLMPTSATIPDADTGVLATRTRSLATRLASKRALRRWSVFFPFTRSHASDRRARKRFALNAEKLRDHGCCGDAAGSRRGRRGFRQLSGKWRVG